MELIIAISILLTSLAGIVVSIALLWTKVIKPGYRGLKKIGRMAEVVHDLPQWCASVDTVLKELQPNGGGSIKDVTNQTRAEVEVLKSLVTSHISDPQLHSANVEVHNHIEQSQEPQERLVP